MLGCAGPCSAFNPWPTPHENTAGLRATREGCKAQAPRCSSRHSGVLPGGAHSGPSGRQRRKSHLMKHFWANRGSTWRSSATRRACSRVSEILTGGQGRGRGRSVRGGSGAGRGFGRRRRALADSREVRSRGDWDALQRAGLLGRPCVSQSSLPQPGFVAQHQRCMAATRPTRPAGIPSPSSCLLTTGSTCATRAEECPAAAPSWAGCPTPPARWRASMPSRCSWAPPSSAGTAGPAAREARRSLRRRQVEGGRRLQAHHGTTREETSRQQGCAHPTTASL